MHPSTSTPDVKALAVKVARVALPLIGRRRPDPLNPSYKPWGKTDQQLYELQLVRDQLQEEGFQYLGNGAFSVAYTHVDYPDRVLKIAIHPDSAAASWWKYCAENPGPHKPVVYVVGALGNDSLASRVDFAWMKRYEPGDYGTREKLVEAYSCGRDLPDVLIPQIEGIAEVMCEAEDFGHEDLHAGNLMQDQDTGNWIVMDPVYDGG